MLNIEDSHLQISIDYQVVIQVHKKLFDNETAVFDKKPKQSILERVYSNHIIQGSDEQFIFRYDLRLDSTHELDSLVICALPDVIFKRDGIQR